MSGEQLAVIFAALFGGGGLGAVIVNAIANRKRVSAETEKIKADCLASLSGAYETRLDALTKRAVQLEAKVDQLETQVSGLRTVLSDREATILNLQQENADLQAQLDKMSAAVKGRDKRIRELERQVAELTERLNAMNGKGENTADG